MATDALPTLESLVNEGMDKAGDRSQSKRAKAQWMPEIKNDIFMAGKKLKSLHTTAVLVLTTGLSRYSMPTDYSSDMTLQLLSGTVTGTAAGGTSGSITLANAGDASVGNRILITANTAKASFSQITAINSTTKIATVSPNFREVPDSTSTYTVISRYEPVKQRPLWDLRGDSHSGSSGRPKWYFPLGDSNDTELELYPVPDDAYGIELTYYADITELDLDSTLLQTLYKRWRNLFVQGVYYKTLDSIGDTRAKEEEKKFFALLQNIVARDQYGMDLSNLTASIVDY